MKSWAPFTIAALGLAGALTFADAASAQAPAGGGAPGVSGGGGRGGFAGGAGPRGGGGRGGPGMAAQGPRGGFAAGPRGGGAPMGGAPQMRMQQMQMQGGIGPRIRSGAIDGQRYGNRPGQMAQVQSLGGARPLTVRPGVRPMRPYGYDRRRWRRGYYPGVVAAAPFYYPDYEYDYAYGAPYGYDPGYFYDEGYDAPVPAYGGPAYTERVYSVPRAAAPLGSHCATPQKVCQLYSPAQIGLGCSCRAPAGLPRFRGVVAR